MATLLRNLHKVVEILRTSYSDAFSLMDKVEFRLKFC